MSALETLNGWLIRFSEFMNLAAKGGPSAKPWRQTDEYQEAMADITWQQTCAVYNRQRKCTHLKGRRPHKAPGRLFARATHADYAVTMHTFIDSRSRIKCMRCGIEAWSHSGQDFKFRWMLEMVENSTNRPSSSEQMLLEVTQGEAVLGTFPDTEAGRAKLRARFPNWDGTVSPYRLMDVTKEDDGLNIPEGHSPIKGVEASTPEAGPDSPGAIIVTAHDDLLYREQK